MNQNYFSGVQFVPGVGYVDVGSAPAAPLGDDASVMMISGLGSEARQVSVDPVTGKGTLTAGQPMTVVTSALQKRVVFLGIDLPLWAWVLIGLGLLGAGWAFFRNRKT